MIFQTIVVPNLPRNASIEWNVTAHSCPDKNLKGKHNYKILAEYYVELAEVPSVVRVLNGLSVDAVYPILLLCPPETPVPSLSCRILLLGSLLCPLVCWFLLNSTCKRFTFCKGWPDCGRQIGGKLRKEKKLGILFAKIDMEVYQNLGSRDERILGSRDLRE